MLQINQTENFACGWNGAQALDIQCLGDAVTALTHGMRDQPESIVRGVTEKLDILEQVGLCKVRLSRKLLNLALVYVVLNEPKIFPKFPRILLKVVHWGHLDRYIQNVPPWFTTSMPFWLILGFTGWGHHDHTTGDTAKKLFE